MKDQIEKVTVRLLSERGQVMSDKWKTPSLLKTEAFWKAILSDSSYPMVRAKGTERAFCGQFHDHHQRGIYVCVGCGLPVFRADDQFDSGTGWPSFFQPVARENVSEEDDTSYGMQRVEIHCTRCNAHFGHVFPDGPKITGLRYCVNSAALVFFKYPGEENQKLETIILGAGCFWGVEEFFRTMPGIEETTVGYAGGILKNPTYQDVCTDQTGHVEVVRLRFDPAKIKLQNILDAFWDIHDPTTLNRQGPDVGSQYRSAIFFTSPFQESVIWKSLDELEKNKRFSNPITTQIEWSHSFYLAEEHHQKYSMKHGLRGCHRVTK